MAVVQVRYIVDDIDAAILFYTKYLGFQKIMHPSPFFAMLSRGDLCLVLSKPGGGPGGGQAMENGTLPKPGGWNRFAIEVSDVESLVDSLRKAGVYFRSNIIKGMGGNQCLIEDPSGNLVELFQPIIPEARLDPKI